MRISYEEAISRCWAEVDLSQLVTNYRNALNHLKGNTHLICVLKGGVYVLTELSRHLTIPVTMDFMSVSSYGDDTKSSGIVRIVKDLDEPLIGKDVLIVEDIIDSGRTLYYLMGLMRERKPNSIKLCTLLDKPERRVRDVRVDYLGFEIEDRFVVGCGMDYQQKYRNLPYIGEIVLTGEEN